MFCRAPPPPLLPPGVGGLYTPSASFQTLLANISAAQRTPVVPSKPSPSSDYLTSPAAPNSPPISPTALSVSSQSDTTPPQDRRSSSIAALRLKAREHELRLEMLRQNGHGDLIS